jgi:diphthamide synthase (EF-2-diphthine--ammonia ligase)
VLRAAGDVEVVGLVTTVMHAFDRVSVHGTRRSLLHAQARQLGLEAHEVRLPHPCSNDEYEDAFQAALEDLRTDLHATHIAFGDLFLEDVRSYRETILEGTGLGPLFPLWGLDTTELAHEMVAHGLDALIVSAPEESPAANLVGTSWHPSSFARLTGVDPCGERGEFHTCVVAAPGLSSLPVVLGPVIRRGGALYADVRLEGE